MGSYTDFWRDSFEDEAEVIAHKITGAPIPGDSNDPQDFDIEPANIPYKPGDGSVEMVTRTQYETEKVSSCGKCNGTGVYQWGACVNGVMQRRGECFQCRGKGWMTRQDWDRTSQYWMHRAAL